MKKIYFLFLILLSTNAWALIPIEGLILGNVQDIRQFDPLEGFLTINSSSLSSEETRLKEYYGLYKEGKNLVLSCDSRGISRYENPWKRSRALSSVVSTLQYIGLNTTIKAIADYARLLNISKIEYENLSDNIVNNYCSNNLTVYSKKLIRKNLSYEYDMDKTSSHLPVLDKSLYPAPLVELSNSKETRTREFLYTLKNFQALCSWGGDTDDLRLLSPYLKNPFIFTIVMNELDRKRIRYNETVGAVVLEEKQDTIQVVCEDLICRNVDRPRFERNFPHMVGATNLRVELQTMYCNDFRFSNYKEQEDAVLSKWIKDKSLEEPFFEASQFISLMTQKSDLIFSAPNFSDLKKLMAKNIQEKGNKWAKERAEELFLDITYEEPMRARLVPLRTTLASSGEFSLNFDYTLGEFDQNLMSEDSLSMTVELDVSQNYIRWLRDEWIRANNKSQYKKQDEIIEKVAEFINHQLKKKEKMFLLSLWNEEMGKIMAKEFTRQLETYREKKLLQIDNKMLKLPIRFRFGLFALQYQYNKFQAEFRSKALTFNQK